MTDSNRDVSARPGFDPDPQVPADPSRLVIDSRDKWSYAQDDGDYAPAPELSPNPALPQGDLRPYDLPAGDIYPGVAHRCAFYRPSRLEGASDVRFMVFLDGSGYVRMGCAHLLNALIAAKRIPPICGIFIDPGADGPGYPIYGGNDNRSLEYDSVDDRYARFLADEVIPATRDRFGVDLSPRRNGIIGTSSSGSAAFGVAWHRPDMFDRVISAIGSFVDIRGAHAYPSLVRREQRKDIRVLLQDGAKDLDTVFGNWPLANQAMASALDYRGYDYRFEYGAGGHNTRHLSAILPDAMGWLWR